MRNLLALGGLILVIFLGLGWYLDWYRLKSTTGEDGKQHINLDVNANKVTEDINKEKNKVVNWLTKDQNNQTVQPSTNGNTTSFRPGQNPTPPGNTQNLPAPQ